MSSTKLSQRGVGMIGVVFIIAMCLFLAVLGMKVVPAYLHNAQIERLFKAVANDTGMQNATVREIRESYSKRAMMDSISEVSVDDIEISKEGGTLSLSAKYVVKIPVAGNMNLLLEFNPRSSK